MSARLRALGLGLLLVSGLPAPARPGGPPPANPGTSRRGGVQVLSPQPPPASWRERVQKARLELPMDDPRGLLEALRGDDPARSFAVLSLENEGKVRFQEKLLRETLQSTRVRLVARAAALLLARRGTETGLDALVEHLEARGPAEDVAVELLIQTGTRKGRELLLERASHATRGDRAGLLSIRALAFHDGPEVTLMLNRLSEDWSPEVRQAARESLELRGKAGLATRTALKAPPETRTLFEVGRND